jgi:hypothetical protein
MAAGGSGRLGACIVCRAIGAKPNGPELS